MLRLRCPAASHSAHRPLLQSAACCRPGRAARAVARPRAAAADAAAAQPPQLDERGQLDETRRAKKRRAAPGGSPEQQAVLHAGAAVADGPLPEVLAASFPARFPTLSAARRVIRKDLVLVAGQLGSCKTEVAAGQLLQQLEPVAQRGKGPRAVTLEVAYEDDEVAVVQKPWGVKMYGGDARRTVAGALRAGALQPSSAADALAEPKAVHRLDAAVGGLLVVAKTAGAAAALSQQWRERRVHKVYTALLCGRLEPAAAAAAAAAAGAALLLQAREAPSDAEDEDEEAEDASVDASGSQQQDSSSSDELPEVLPPLPALLQLQLQGRPPFAGTSAADLGLEPVSAAGSTDASAAAVHVVDLPLEGKPCYSLYSVLGYSRSSRFGGWLTTAALSPVTGRKHQLRRHCAALGHPILGDGKHALDTAEHVGNQGIFLESAEVWFEHPKTGERLQLRIPEPKRFATMREQQHSRWRKLSLSM